MKQYTLLTANGINKLLKTASDGSKIALKEIVVSDYEGELSEQIISIPNEKYRGAINAITIDENDNNILDVDAIIPPEVGGFYIKTAGIYCDDGSLFAVARLADTYKPLLNEGSSKDITLNFKLQISNANESIILKVDNNVALATRKWSENQFLKKTDKIDAYTKQESDKKFALKDDLPPFATETKAGIAKLKNSITAKAEDTAVTEKAVADAIEAIKTDKAGSINKGTTGYAKLENGLIFQWGRTSAPDREDKFYIYFPITFPSTCLNVLMTLEAGVDWNFYDCVLQIYSKSSSSATCICGAWGGGEIKSGADVHWLAIGY